MIKIEKASTVGWEAAIRGMRAPLQSWDKSDSGYSKDIEFERQETGHDAVAYSGEYGYFIGPNDQDLMRRLRNAGTDHRKFMRMIAVYMDITAPRYFWPEFDAYKIGTVANSTSTMHTIHKREFVLEDFSFENMIGENGRYLPICDYIVSELNYSRKLFLETNNKKYWRRMIELLPQSYNQKRTVMLNYEVLANMYKSRKAHKLDEWREFCEFCKNELPYSWLITGEE